MELTPELSDEFKKLNQFRLAGRFLNESVGAELTRTVDIVWMCRSREDNRDNPKKLRLGAQPGQQFETIHARHSQVEEEEFRPGKFGSVGELSAAVKVIDRLGAGIDGVEVRSQGRMRRGELGELDIVIIVVDVKDVKLLEMHNR
jgi:hypothetical protein